MLLIAEKINTINKKVAEALRGKDKNFFRDMAIKQVENDSIYSVDINVGSNISEEPENMKWAVSIVEEALDGRATISVDSSNPKTILAGFEAMNNKKGAFVDSISLQGEKYKELLPLVKEYDLNVIALPIDQKEIPNSSEKRYKNAYLLAEKVEEYGIQLNRLFIDCLVTPVVVNTDNAVISLGTLKKIKNKIQGIKTIICISGISFGIPGKSLLNSTFLTMLAQEGLDAAFVDPFDKGVMDSLVAIETLKGNDEFCMNYLKRFRGNKKA